MNEKETRISKENRLIRKANYELDKENNELKKLVKDLEEENKRLDKVIRKNEGTAHSADGRERRIEKEELILLFIH